MIGRLRGRRPSAWFAAAAVLGSVAWFGTMRAAVNGETAEVIVAALDLPIGSRLATEGQVRRVAVPAQAVLPGMLSDLGQVGPRLTAVPIAAGEPITDSVLGGQVGHIPAPLAPGERAMSVPASAAGAALPVLVPGARVDIVASLGDSGESQSVVRAAEVITTHLPDDSVGQSDDGAILLRVLEADALRLSGALDRGAGVRVLPRPTQEVIAR